MGRNQKNYHLLEQPDTAADFALLYVLKAEWFGRVLLLCGLGEYTLQGGLGENFTYVWCGPVALPVPAAQHAQLCP
jgi:hypothetical protein